MDCHGLRPRNDGLWIATAYGLAMTGHQSEAHHMQAM